jgi:hypothetical protein
VEESKNSASSSAKPPQQPGSETRVTKVKLPPKAAAKKPRPLTNKAGYIKVKTLLDKH